MLDKKKFYINGKWIDPETDNDFHVVQPRFGRNFRLVSK